MSTRTCPASSRSRIVTAVIFTVKALATYGQAVMLSRIGNRIIAENQRRMFDALITPEPRLLLRAAFVGIHGAADHRRDRRERR